MMGNPLSLKEELQKRGFLNQYTSDDLFPLYEKGGETFYFGVDPTATSLHLGNFIVFMSAVNYMKRGNHLILIVGGATGMIGDPGGRDSERTFLDQETLTKNVAAIQKQVGGILQHLTELSGAKFSFEVKNNIDFYIDTTNPQNTMGYLDFLREVGKYITVNQMLAKETVKRRIDDPNASISYTEFSYMLLQGYDFVRLYQERNCKLQISGADQRGNIVTGIEIARKKLDQELYGMTSPLILDSTGKKFGKSMGNALWLDSTMTTPFQIYQYFINTNDEDIERFLKLFTLLSLEDIDAIVAQHQAKPEDRYGQQQLARYVVQTLHGHNAMEAAVKATEFLFGSGDKVALLSSLSADDLDTIGREVGVTHIREDKTDDPQHELSAMGGKQEEETSSWTILDALVASGLESSRGAAKKDIEAGAIYLNEEKVADINTLVDSTNSINGYHILRKGKKNYKLIQG